MRRFDGWTAENRAALAVLAASALLLGSAVYGARRIAPAPEAGEARALAQMPDVAARAPASETQILRAVARDPFRPDRRRPPGRYRMPGTEPPPSAPSTDFGYSPPVAAPVFTLLGTVVLGDGRGMAALAGLGGESRIVRVGEEMDGFRVVRVGNGTATLTNGDTTLVLETQGGAP